MEKDKYYKILFLTGAIWNIFVAIACLFASLFMLDLVSVVFGIQPPLTLIWLHFFLGFIFIFGIGYFYISKNLEKNHLVVVMGVMEKYMVTIVALIFFLISDIGLIGFLLCSVDFIFGCLYLEFLLYKRKS